MSIKSQNKISKKRIHEDSTNFKKCDQKDIIFSKNDVESRSNSSCSKRSHKKIIRSKNNEAYFNVDKIIGMKVCQGLSWYKVRWQGYSENEDSWEPEENLANVLDLVEDFIRKKEDENEESRVSNGNRTRNNGGYEYVPSNELVACKTKYFDDIRDGKIDLTKNDLYSRVKTRKRLQSEALAESEEATVVEDNIVIKQEVVLPEATLPSLCEKNKYYQVNLFEMTEEFMKNNNFDKCLTTKSSTIDDISSFNYSVSPETNNSDDLLPQISPNHHHSLFHSVTKSVATQTDDLQSQFQLDSDYIEISAISEDKLEPQLQKVISKINESLLRKDPIERVVTSEAHLLNIYSRKLKFSNSSAVVLPTMYCESDLVSVNSFEDLKTAIILNKYSLLKVAFESGITFNLCERFSPENINPLFLAVMKNQSNIVRLLLRHGALVNYYQIEHCPESALMLASTHGHIQVVKALLDYGAFTDFRGHSGKNALYCAIENGRIDVVKMLLKHGTDFFKVSNLLSAVSLVNDLILSNRLSKSISFDLLSLLKGYHSSFISSLNRTVSRYLARQMAKQSSMLFPHQWVSVVEQEVHIDFLIDDSILTNLDTPILLLVHGSQAECNFDFWLENNCCCVESVYVNDECQSSLGTNNFVTTLWPLKANNNKLTVHFSNSALLSQEEKQVRVAIVAVSIACGNSNKNSFHFPSHPRHHH